MIDILHGDCREVMRTLADASVASIVCDPPYELGFMGKAWDRSGIANDVDVWRECLRVLKPGGHLLAFGGSRTYHRMACAIEDSGFEIRDQIMWIYGSGFPKSLDVSKAIDKAAGAERERIRGVRSGVVGTTFAQDAWSLEFKDSVLSDDPITPEAVEWQGWGTALKPAHEPICMARKPLKGTVAANVLAFGTGGLNIDGCRIEGAPEFFRSNTNDIRGGRYASGGSEYIPAPANGHPLGRWPANLVHDGSDEVVALFPEERGANGARNCEGDNHGFAGERQSVRSDNWGEPRDELGNAARFFYTSKASRYDRNDGCDGMPSKALNWSSGEQSPGTFQSPNTDRSARNHHPTVKPTDLMRWLCRLVTPPGGTVLDPFMGSGSTLKAAELEGFNAIGIELDAEYIEIARARIASDMPLFKASA